MTSDFPLGPQACRVRVFGTVLNGDCTCGQISGDLVQGWTFTGYADPKNVAAEIIRAGVVNVEIKLLEPKDYPQFWSAKARIVEFGGQWYLMHEENPTPRQ